ncbi:hypothetical protein PR048_019735 [Dryococelus australis]|uniref:Ig-like domain-containing protein n=1 Tax=Dryococelus australis TaxID=614101 RepID=A0ABQ9H4D6_9NEOP|nr:hypothetical protein PR048_019735 [Dryococelus australis]
MLFTGFCGRSPLRLPCATRTVSTGIAVDEMVSPLTYVKLSRDLRSFKQREILFWHHTCTNKQPLAAPTYLEFMVPYVVQALCACLAISVRLRDIKFVVHAAVAPELQSTFIEQTLQPGPPVSLRCVASGNPPPRFTWLLDAVELLPRSYVLGSFLDQAGDVVSHLNISSAKVQHGGLYTCVARNLLGAAHHSATLNIYGKDLHPSLHSGARPGSRGELDHVCDHRLSHGPVVGTPQVWGANPRQGMGKASWVYSLIVSIRKGVVDVFHNIKEYEEIRGGYVPKGPPSARAPRNITAVAGTDVYLRCPVAGFPISSVTWQRGGDSLPSHLRHRTFPNGTLLVRQVDGAADRGEYLCFAANQQGQTAQSRIHLDVMKPPTIAPFQFPSEIQQGMRVQVTCSIISGDFPIAISWRKDGESLSEVSYKHHGNTSKDCLGALE